MKKNTKKSLRIIFIFDFLDGLSGISKKLCLFVIFWFTALPTWGNDLNDAQLSCLLEPSNRVKISSQVAGIVKEIKANRGDRVKKGQLLLMLEDGVARTTLDMAKAKLEYASTQLDRNEEIVLKGYMSDAQHHEFIVNKELARLAVKEAEELLKQQAIYSPITGVVVKRNVSVGEYVGIDPLFEIVSLDPLYAEVVLRAKEYGAIDTGMKTFLQLVAQPDTRYSGKITIVDPIIDAASGTFGVRVEMPNPGEKVPAGVNCQVQFAHDSVNGSSLTKQTVRH